MFSEGNSKIYCDSSLNIKKHLEPNSVDLTITSPPYWDILNRKRTADKKEIQNYGNSKKDLGNITDYEDFLLSLQNVFKEVYDVTKPGRYCVVVVMDLRKGPKLYQLHSDLTRKMEENGFTLNDIIIWDRQKEYNNMRPLGYPYSFIVNKVHEYILIYKKGSIK
jgi:DNA modification methylase